MSLQESSMVALVLMTLACMPGHPETAGAPAPRSVPGLAEPRAELALAAAPDAKKGPGSLRGVVVDAETGARVSGASVSALYLAWGQTHEVTLSGGAGEFEFPTLSPAGEYRISCAAEGYREQVLNVTVGETGSSRVTLRMHAE